MTTTTQVRQAGFADLIGDRTVRLLALCSLINSCAFFGMMPFLALYLADITSLPPAAIGAFTGSIALVGAVGALAGGAITDRAGAGSLLRAGLALYTLLAAALATVTAPVLVLPLIVCLGGALMLVGPSLKKLMSLAAGEGGELVFRIRFMTVSAGAALGPLAGAAAYSVSHRALFAVSAALFACCVLLVHARRDSLRALDVRVPAVRQGRWTWTHSLRDGRFRLVLVSAVLITLVFAQLESMIPLYLKGSPATAPRRCSRWSSPCTPSWASPTSGRRHGSPDAPRSRHRPAWAVPALPSPSSAGEPRTADCGFCWPGCWPGPSGRRS